ncbi:MAG: hypothetical protein BMS9Abin02_1713 [Anaerolineae bacterium]|nr:MAG: hypothetical protein BMS9Abin02_1713 [Anaerolineae bacterium]
MAGVNLLDLECFSLKNESITLFVAKEVGPRIVALIIDGENIFAELPDLTIDNLDSRPFHFWGGHRLWYAPEIPERTYTPDDKLAVLEINGSRLTSTQIPERKSGIQKTISVWLPKNRPIVVVDHTITNKGQETIDCAPWAITQLKPGGTAILPLNRAYADHHGLQPNRSIVLWPYTDMNSSHIRWGNRYLFVEANMKEGALKVGFPNPVGWLAYYRNHRLFVKLASYQADAAYYDYSASSQCYCNEQFLELETLGPQVALEPGMSVGHKEVWEIFRDFDLSLDEKVLDRSLDKIGIADSSSYLSG